MNFFKKAGFVLAGGAAAFAAYYTYLSKQYYRIPDHQPLNSDHNPEGKLEPGVDYSAITFNVGFGAYNHDFDFFMDSGTMLNGKKVHGHRGTAISKHAVLTSTNGVINTLKDENPDFMLLQEIDTNSTRSFHVNQVELVSHAFPKYAHLYASDFHTAYLAVPITNPHGIARSGLLTLSKYHINKAERRQYPVSNGPIEKFVDLDRCFEMMRLPVTNGKELILINSHMSAYDKNGDSRAKQIHLLAELMKNETAAGNYVIIGGDFNQVFGADMIGYFHHQEEIPGWVSVLNDPERLPENSHVVMAKNRLEVPTCRAAEMPYDPEINYMTICDGFIISNNVEAEAINLDTDFAYADHNPVRLNFKLK
ncbi:MAG: endonuclease/exonuclease/phosphatase family protein [Lactobacillus sp.]|jgi:endonuclease/exonuclease/phosphatase family metal-dependent hydrolase|nr:endonuclease/exonuclease/phosphatase family protein [Lactobacillus sp.]MCH3906317.1 endonuclease/exonuclease/phosphatase family protein [Lactobacillus sp.]MCH3990109.1 endonuclease/exonuclease/phosphatase family protein [Lactobacillus sp.]MCH4069177.1 endonuclease/exonuclease/phosphatase family protein [Lactobacillus sp.]MCI1303479.1 endonuclease/exonuclease/phosphatase family protein [Lactobacillus sp.]